MIGRYVNADGEDAMRLTKTGKQITSQLAMMGDKAQSELMDALLGSDTEKSGSTPRPPP